MGKYMSIGNMKLGVEEGGGYMCDKSSNVDSNFLFRLLFCSSCSNHKGAKTFRPKKHIQQGSHQYELMKHAEATLGSGNLRQAVVLPDGEDLNEWVAVNSKFISIVEGDSGST